MADSGLDAGAYAGAFAIGVLVGLAELLSRHRDYPLASASSGPSIGYLALNGFLSVAALLAIEAWRPSWLAVATATAGDPAPPLDRFKAVLAAGFGAAAFFRSSLFKLRTAEGDLSIGPAIIIDIFLRVIDDAVDLTLGEKRLDDAASIMDGIDFDKAAKSLPTYCFAALRRLPPEAQQQFAFQLKALRDTADIDSQVKAMSLGLSIMTLTGRPILKKAVDQLGKRIR